MLFQALRKTGSDRFKLQRLHINRRSRNQAHIRKLCTSCYVGDETVLCRVLGRYKMFVDTEDLGLSPHLILDGYWEMGLTEVIAACVKPGMTVVDIGANLGYFSLLMADLVGPQGQLHAFEPNPPIAARLRKSLDVNGFGQWSTVHRNPLGDQNGKRQALVVPSNEPKNAFIVEAGSHHRAIELTGRRLDSYDGFMQADIIKIDADNSERAIWRGMSAMLADPQRPMIIFLEFCSSRYDDPDAFLAEIQQAGFDLSLVTLFDGVQPISRAQVLAAPVMDDQMLMLRRSA